MGNSNCDDCGHDKSMCECPKEMVAQVGGDHYVQGKFGHWDMVAMTRMGYLEGNATKYVSRWRTKNGQQDLDKARSYVEKIVELSEGTAYCNTSLFLIDFKATEGTMSQWMNNVELTAWEADFMWLLATWETTEDLQEALGLIAKLAAEGLQGAGGTNAPQTGQTPTPAAPCGGAGGTMAQPTASSTSTGVVTNGKTNHPAPFGYEGDE